MALYPNSFRGKDQLLPGAHGNTFSTSFPGYNAEEDRINRSNSKLNTASHDVPNIKYNFDNRLPVLFRYGYAFGYNQIVIPKGRVVAADPFMDMVDFDMKKAHNTLTLANGGMPVKIRPSGMAKTAYVASATNGLLSPDFTEVPGQGKEWMPVAGYDDAYADSKLCRPFTTERANAQLATADCTVDAVTGKIKKDGAITNIRPGNQPLGIMARNEYTRDDDAFNGIMPGAILTDAMVELPWFLFKDKAEGNLWGSAYGGLYPGALVKSDENGRVILSPLSNETAADAMTLPEYEAERQQVIGQVYAVSQELVPEGAAKYAQWAISDIMNFEGFNPTVYSSTGRRGEDSVSNSPYKSTGEYPGYPYDKAYMNHDLHMLESSRNTYDERMQHEYRYDHGIPGLTDGYNAVATTKEDKNVGSFGSAGGADYTDMYFRTRIENVEEGSIQISAGTTAYAPCTVGASLVATSVKADGTTALTGTFLTVKYVNELQGIVVVEVSDKAAADAFFAEARTGATVSISLKYVKRGLAGVPTFMDWDGCIGSVKVLLQK